jgi:hypothetical protein
MQSKQGSPGRLRRRHPQQHPDESPPHQGWKRNASRMQLEAEALPDEETKFLIDTPSSTLKTSTCVETLNALAVEDALRPSQRRGTWVLSQQAPPATPKHRTTEQPKGEDRPSSCNETTSPIPQKSGKQISLDPRRRWHRHRYRPRRRRGRDKRTHQIRRGCNTPMLPRCQNEHRRGGEGNQLLKIVVVAVPHHVQAQRPVAQQRRRHGRGLCRHQERRAAAHGKGHQIHGRGGAETSQRWRRRKLANLILTYSNQN